MSGDGTRAAPGRDTLAGRIDAVVIGRNEGARLEACLASLQGRVRRIVYVDSGSTDGSVNHARGTGAEVVELDPSSPFTAARARNAGLEQLASGGAEYVQFVDGDCTVRDGWIETAGRYLDAHPDVALACGRRREMHPEHSVYNRLCDIEWDAPPGEARFCGGDALARRDAVLRVGGFDPTLIAGEEPELCLRLRRAGWRIRRLPEEMTLHDAAMTRFAQWWQRSRRAGHAHAEGAWRHGRGPERHWVRETLRALAWGAVLPAGVIATALAAPGWSAAYALVLVAAYPLQVLRLAVRRGAGHRASWEWAFFTVLGKFPEAAGVLRFALGRLSRRRAGLIEYK